MYRQPTKYHKSFRWQEAVSKIKALSKQNRSNTAPDNTVQEIYHNVHKTEQNRFVMNALLTFCLKSNDTQTIMDLHEDVIHTPDVSVGLLIQCCKQLVKSDINITVKLLDHIYTTMNDSEMKIKTTLIDLYSKCLQLDRAIQVFESVSVSNRDAILIGVMMKSFTYHHQFERAMDLFESYHQSNPPMHSAHDSLKIFYIEACTKTNNIGKAEQLITASLETECVNVWLNTRFIYFYDTIQQVNKAWNVFKVQMDGNHVDIICLNAMLKCFINHKQYTNSMDLYHTFVGKISFNDLSHLLYIKALKQSDTKNVEIVRDIFNQIINDKKQIHNSKTRTVLVGSIMKYMIDSDASAQAVEMYENCDDRIEHDDVSYLLYLRACSNTNSHQKGMHLINTISRIHHRSIELINTIIDFYGHCNAIQDAQRIFDAISDSKRNYITVSNYKCPKFVMQHRDPRFQTTKDIVSHITIGSKQLNNSLQGILFWNAMKRKDVSKIVIGCDSYIEESTRSHFHGLTKYFPWMDAVSDDGVFAGIDERPLVAMNSDWNDDEVEVKSSQEVTGNRTFLDSQESDGDLTQSNSHQSPTIEAARITNVSRNSRSNGSRSYPRRCDIIQRNDIVTRSVAHQNMILSTIPLIDNMIQSEKWTEMNTLYKKLLSAMSNQRIEFIADIILNPIIHELNSIIKESTQKLVLHPIVLSGSSITANSFIAYNNAFNISDKMNTLINHCIGLTIAIMAKSMKHHAKGSADRITTRSELTKLKLQPKVMKQINRMCYFARMCAKYHKVFWINVSCISYQQSPSIQALVHLLDTDYDIIKGTMLIMQRNNNHNMQMQLKDPWTIEYIKKFFVFCS